MYELKAFMALERRCTLVVGRFKQRLGERALHRALEGSNPTPGIKPEFGYHFAERRFLLAGITQILSVWGEGRVDLAIFKMNEVVICSIFATENCIRIWLRYSETGLTWNCSRMNARPREVPLRALHSGHRIHHWEGAIYTGFSIAILLVGRGAYFEGLGRVQDSRLGVRSILGADYVGPDATDRSVFS